MNPVRFSSAFAFAIAVALTALTGGASAQSQSSTITINGCASLTPNGGTTFTCVASTTPTNPSAPAGCTATASPASNPLPQPGGALVTLGVTGCTAGTFDASTTYAWSKSQGSISGVSNAAAGSDTPGANTLSTAITITYTVAACNGTACNSFQAPGVQQAGTGIVTPPPGANIVCTAANTINPPTGPVSFTATRTINFGWGPVGAAQFLHTQDFGGFGPGEALVLTFTTPESLGNNATGNIGWSPDVSASGSEPQVRRIATLSNLPCDFSYNPIGSGSTRLGVSTGVNWSLGPNTLGVPALTSPNTTYYVNIRHYEGCPLSHCNMQVDFVKPAGF